MGKDAKVAKKQEKKVVVESSSDSDSSSEEVVKKTVVAAKTGDKRARATSNASNASNGKSAKKDTKAVPAKKAVVESSDSDDSDSSVEVKPVAKKVVPVAVAKKAAPAKKADSSDEDSDEESSEDVKPVAKKAAAKKADSSDEESEAEVEVQQKHHVKEAGPSGEEEKTELFVGNLAFATSEGAIRSAFNKFGTITNLKMPTDPQGRPKGFAFIQYASHSEAQKASDALNGQDIDGTGRGLRINFSGGAPPLVAHRESRDHHSVVLLQVRQVSQTLSSSETSASELRKVPSEHSSKDAVRLTPSELP